MKPRIHKIPGTPSWVCCDYTAFGTSRSGHGRSPKSAYDAWCRACSE